MRFSSWGSPKDLVLILSGLLLVLTVTGCQTARPISDQGQAGTVKTVVESEPLQPEPEPLFTLGPGDGLDIKFFHNPELNENQTVRPDGKITLQLVGDVMVQGKTPEELRAELVRLYTPELKIPEVAIVVRSLSDRRVYVGGEVNKPGIVPMPGRLTALEAIVEAGGFKMETAQLKSVVIIRQMEGKYRGSLVDFSAAPNGEAGQPFFLRPRDIVYVPETTIVKVDRWVDQYIYRILPMLKNFGVYYNPTF